MSESATRGNLVVNKALLGLCAAHGWPKMLRSVEWGQPQCGERQRTGEGGGQGLGRSHCGGPSAAAGADKVTAFPQSSSAGGVATQHTGALPRSAPGAVPENLMRPPPRGEGADLPSCSSSARRPGTGHTGGRDCAVGNKNHPRPRPDPGWGARAGSSSRR